MKTNCYIFDFSLNRALMQIADYGCRLNIDAAVSPEQKVKEFISYLPVLAYDGNMMRPIDVAVEYVSCEPTENLKDLFPEEYGEGDDFEEEETEQA